MRPAQTELTVAEQTIASEFERFTDVQREQARAAGQVLAPGMSLKQHFAPDTATFRELEVWRVERTDGRGAYDVWLCSLPRGVVFEAGTTRIVAELSDAPSASEPVCDTLARAAATTGSAARQLFGRWGRRLLANLEQREPGEAPDDALEAGAFVWVRHGESWWPASIVRRAADGFRVHYDGWPESADEDVAIDRLRRAVTRADVAPGDRVLVAQRQGFLAASVVALQADGRVRVRYDAAPGGAEEDVLPARIER